MSGPEGDEQDVLLPPGEREWTPLYSMPTQKQQQENRPAQQQSAVQKRHVSLRWLFSVEDFQDDPIVGDCGCIRAQKPSCELLCFSAFCGLCSCLDVVVAANWNGCLRSRKPRVITSGVGRCSAWTAWALLIFNICFWVFMLEACRIVVMMDNDNSIWLGEERSWICFIVGSAFLVVRISVLLFGWKPITWQGAGDPDHGLSNAGDVLGTNVDDHVAGPRERGSMLAVVGPPVAAVANA